MEDLKQFIKNRVYEKEKQKQAQNGLILFVILASFMSFLMLCITFFKNSDPQFSLNKYFYGSTGIVLITSLFVHLSYTFYKQDKLNLGFRFLILTALSTVLFATFQILGWKTLKIEYLQKHKNLTSYINFISIVAFHFLHFMAGLIYLSTLVKRHFSFQIHSKNINPIKFAAIFWHFLAFVWLLAFIIFL